MSRPFEDDHELQGDPFGGDADDFEGDEGEFEEGEEAEVVIHIEPRLEALQKFGLTMENLQNALPDALDEYHEGLDKLDEGADYPELEDAPVTIAGQTYRLGDLASINILDEDAEFDEDDLDDDDDDDDDLQDV